MVFNIRTDARAWNHVALTLNTTTGVCQGYINNTYAPSSGSVTGTGTLSNMTNFYLGQNWGGYIQYFSIYTSVLSSTQITNIYNSQINVLPQSNANYSVEPSSPFSVTTTQAILYTPLTYLTLATNTTDSGTSPQTVTTNGTVSFTTIGGKACAYFNNSTNNYLTLPYSNPTQLTLAFWFYPIDTTYYTMASISNSSYSPVLQFDPYNSSVTCYTALPNQWNPAPTATTNGAGAWSFITITIDQSTYTEQVYMNGSYVTSGTGSAAFPTRGNMFYIGKSGDNGRAFNGYIRKFSFYNSILNSTQIAALYAQG